MSEVHHIAFFDFDGTLTCGDSLIPFLHMVRGTPLLMYDLLAVSPWLVAYMLRLLRNDRAKEELFKQTLAGTGIDELRRKGQCFAENYLPGMLRAVMIERLRHHQRLGHSCVLVSASLDLYLQPWSQMNGFTHCLATSLLTDEQKIITGRLSGSNCYGEEKVKRIQEFLERLGKPARTYAYGDSSGDHYMLAMVDEGYLVRSEHQWFSKRKESIIRQ